MDDSVLNNIDELLGKLQTFKQEYLEVTELMNQEKYLKVEDVAKIMGVCRQTATEYMMRPDFPRIKCGKSYRVSSTALFLYNLKQRI